MQGPPGRVCWPSTCSPELLRPGKGTKRTPNSLCPCRVPRVSENLNLSRLDLRSAWNPGPALDSALQSTLHPEQCRTRKHTPWAWTNPVWSIHCEHSPHPPVIFAGFLPSQNTTEQVSVNKWPPSPPCVRVEIRHGRDFQTEEATINKEG